MKIREGTKIPLGYGIAYWEYWSGRAVVLPVPVNLIVSLTRRFYFFLIEYRPTKMDELLRESYERGRSDHENL